MKTLTFSNNDQMPALGLGTWKSEPGQVYEAVKTAVKSGYRHIDCAPIYANEHEVGRALSECIEEGIVSREELWITSKLWNSNHAREDVIPGLEQTLNDLKLDYLDLFLIHWPVAMKKGVSFPRSGEDFVYTDEIPLSKTWAGMEDAKNQGLARHIGVSNFGVQNLEIVLAEAKQKPEMNQVESHPYLAQKELLEYCTSKGIHMTAYSPLGSNDRPERLKAENEPRLLNDGIIAEIASSKGASNAQILISWALHRGVAVIPKSVNEGRINQNLASEEIELSTEDLSRISALDKGYRFIDGSFWAMEGSPYSLEDVWK